ncbi:MAG TPA: UvrD-helicase domain-containing protein [Polyangiaceae bacterium]
MFPFESQTLPLWGTTLVEASAGTGKTHAISTLFVRLLVERELHVERLLVLTFTEAATLELKDRVRERVDTALAVAAGQAHDQDFQALFSARAEPETRARDVSRLRVALANIDQASIFTIHGFCHKLLTDHAFETGAHFDAELLTDDTALRDEVMADFWASELEAAPPDLAEVLARHKLTPARCRNLADLVTRHPRLTVLGGNAAGSDGEVDSDRVRIARFRENLVGYLRRELPRRKAALNLLSFDDLLERLYAALRGPHAAGLAANVRRRFPVALIDEFQDTDPTQYAIFEAIYRAPAAQDDTGLFLIGDPKQAIYGFRGADIFAYTAAKRNTPADRQFTLTTNYRSDPGLVDAVQRVFSGLDRPFLLPGIDHPEIRAKRPENSLSGSGDAGAPFEILFVPRPRGKAFMNKPQAERLSAELSASDIRRLLDERLQLAGRAIDAGDIAVLTRTNQQAFAMQRALAACDVPSVVLGDASVFERPEAHELALVLRAISDPSDSQWVRAALSSELLGVTASELDALAHDESAWESWLESFRRWHELWIARGFVQMFHDLLDSGGIGQRILAGEDGERRMTNLLHLMELLHAASRAADLGPSGVVHWLAQQRLASGTDQSRSEDTQVRLESDERAVKVLTVHRSKGLEFGIVYCPYLWHGGTLGQSEQHCFVFHDPEREDAAGLVWSSGSDEHDAFKRLAEWERCAENLRLLYVALTRARYRCVVTWGALSRDYARSPLAYVLHWPRGLSVPDRDCKALFDRLKPDDGTMRQELAGLEQASQGLIRLREVPAPYTAPRAPQALGSPAELRCRALPATFQLLPYFRTASFSGLVSTAEHELFPAVDDEGRDRDELEDTSLPTPQASAPPKASALLLADFPRGARAGNFFHELLEHIDFSARDFGDMVRAKLASFGYSESLVGTVLAALDAFLDTPLADAAEPLTLRQITLHQRLNELEFHMPVAEGSHGSSSAPGPPLKLDRLTRQQLARVFADSPSDVLPIEYAERVRRLQFLPVEGYLKGYVDLVFQHHGRWYIVDYKTNHLGDTPAAYAKGQLPRVMAASHYFLQYHLYTVALHRYLTQRLRGYDYDAHFGGVYYLFLKGMTPGTGPSHGVFFERPPIARIEHLSSLFVRPMGVAAHDLAR